MAKKFLFDNFFESDGSGSLGDFSPATANAGGHLFGADDAGEEAPRPVETIEEPEVDLPPPPAPLFSVEELEDARKNAYEEGYAKALEESNASVERQTAEAVSQISRDLGDLAAVFESDRELRLKESLRLAGTLVGKLFPGLSRQEGMREIETLLSECLQQLQEEPRLVIRSAVDHIDLLRERCDVLSSKTGFEGRFVILGEEEYGPSDVTLGWADGGAERNLTRQWHEIESLIERSLATRENPKNAPVAAVPIENEPAKDGLVT